MYDQRSVYFSFWVSKFIKEANAEKHVHLFLAFYHFMKGFTKFHMVIS